jgi:hypothetical protein
MAKRYKLRQKQIDKVKKLLNENWNIRAIANTMNTEDYLIEIIRDGGDMSEVFQADRLPVDHPYYKLDGKIQSFNSKGKNLYGIEYTIEDVIAKFGLTPKCYLSGIEFNLLEPNGYHLDHIFPKSRGGTNSLENMGILWGDLNLFKLDMSISYLLYRMRVVLEYQGCIVTKPEEGKLTCQKLFDYDKELRKRYKESNLQGGRDI